MSHEENDAVPTVNGKNEFFSFSGNISELMMAHANLEHRPKKLFNEMALINSHASLFHMIHSVATSWKKTVESNTQSESQKLLRVPQDTSGTAKETKKVTNIPAHAKHLSASEAKSMVSKRQRKRLGKMSSARLIPYLVLISKCIPLPISEIENRCLKGQILCRIQYFTLRHMKKLASQASRSRPSVSKPETTRVRYVTFDSLKDLQWKLYKGLVRRKPKDIVTWREPTFSTGLIKSLTGLYDEYILPLIPSDWIIDDSLKYNVPLPIAANIYTYQSPRVREWGAVRDILGAALKNSTSDNWEQMRGDL